MGRPKLPVEKRRQDVGITPHPDVLAWVKKNVGLGKRFKNITHAFEYGIARLMEEERTAESLGLKTPPVDPGLLDALHARPDDKQGRKARGHGR